MQFMFDQALQKLHAQQLTRHLTLIDSAPETSVMIDGRPVILMASNNYLGLATHPTLKQAAIDAVNQFGVGAGASRLISGTLPPHQALETELARFKHTEAALTFSSGYLANIGLIPALAVPKGLILADRLCHASLIDGCRLSGTPFRVFQHQDMGHLESLLAKHASKHPTLIVTEGVFSMDGDIAPLPDLARLAQTYNARLFIDDAHGTGVLGTHGRGTPEHFGIEEDVPLHMGTLGKALGTSGAYVACPASVIDYVVSTCRSLLYSTAPSPATVAAARAAIMMVQQEPERRERLHTNRQRLQKGLADLGYQNRPNVSPIIPIPIGDPGKTLDMSRRLFARGIYVPAIRPPTVPKGTSRLRLTVTSEHTPEQLDAVLCAFQEVGRDLRLI